MAKYKNKGPPVRPHKSKCRGCRCESDDSGTCLAAFCIYMMARSLVCCPRSAGLLPWHGLKRWERYCFLRYRFVYVYKIQKNFDNHLKDL